MKAITILIILSLASFSSCKKYDEDEKGSWKTVKNRLVNHWKVNKITEQYEGSPALEPQFLQFELSFEKNGDYQSEYWISASQTSISTGTWELSENKDYVIIRNQLGELWQLHVIERLEKDILILSSADSWPKITYELTPA